MTNIFASMTIFTEKQILALTDKNLAIAIRKLSELPVYCGREPTIAGLHGWVFEQTIRHCIQKELKAKRLMPKLEEQVSIGGRARADLQIGNILIEIKTGGLFGDSDVEKYLRYRKAVENRKCRYLFLTAQENHKPYRDGIIKALGSDNTFFLDRSGDWERFTEVVTKGLKKRKL